MRKTTKNTITEVITYHLTENIKYDITVINNKEKSRNLRHVGKNIYEYQVQPLYKKDISLLKSWNPFWGKSKEGIDGYKWLEGDKLPEPQDIDINNIILIQRSRQSFYTLNKEPIPVVVHGDYIEANLRSNIYKLKELRDHFLNHPNIISCSEIRDVPYYNNDSGVEKYLDVLVYPEKEWVQYLLDNEKGRNEIFTPYYNNEAIDFLNIRQFLKPKEDE